MLLNLVIFLRVAMRYVYKTVARRRVAPVHRRPRWYQAQEQSTPSNIPVRAPTRRRTSAGPLCTHSHLSALLPILRQGCNNTEGATPAIVYVSQVCDTLLFVLGVNCDGSYRNIVRVW